MELNIIFFSLDFVYFWILWLCFITCWMNFCMKTKKKIFFIIFFCCSSSRDADINDGVRVLSNFCLFYCHLLPLMLLFVVILIMKFLTTLFTKRAQPILKVCFFCMQLPCNFAFQVEYSVSQSLS